MLLSQVDFPRVSTEADVARYYVSDLSDYKYMLPADDLERHRLNEQSQAINQIFDNKLIWAPISLKDGDTVLDNGSGSGHWLLSVAKELPPTTDLRGIDISTRMFPPDHPSNITFTHNSVTSLPQDWSNTITLIHQRLLVLALQTSQWKVALSEMYRALIPGGYIQLFETSSVLKSPLKELREHKAFTLRHRLSQARHVVVDVTDHLQSWLEECGFINVTTYERGFPMGPWAGEHGSRCLKTALDFYTAIKSPVMQEGGLGLVSSGEEYDTVVGDFVRLCETTPETYLPYWAFIAQKPLA